MLDFDPFEPTFLQPVVQIACCRPVALGNELLGRTVCQEGLNARGMSNRSDTRALPKMPDRARGRGQDRREGVRAVVRLAVGQLEWSAS